jgi:hypothetical protein
LFFRWKGHRRVPQEGGAVPEPRVRVGSGDQGAGRSAQERGYTAQGAAERVHGRIRSDHHQTEGAVPDDHVGRRRGTGTGRFAGSVQRGHRLQRAAAQEDVEEHLQLVRRREDALVAGSGLRASLLQTDSAVRHGRDRRRPGLQERVHRGQLHQGADAQRPVRHHLAAFQHVRAGRPAGGHLQDAQLHQVGGHQPVRHRGKPGHGEP